MEIMLIRHGVSATTNLPKLSLLEYHNWREDYDRLGVLESTDRIFATTRTHMVTAEIVFASTLYRTQQSCGLLMPEAVPTYNSLFNEVRFFPPSWMKMKLNTRFWTTIAGALWYGGLLKEHETMEEAKARAIKACDILIESAENGNVALVGHGFMNLFIFRELRNRGWKNLSKYSFHNWSCTRLVKT